MTSRGLILFSIDVPVTLYFNHRVNERTLALESTSELAHLQKFNKRTLALAVRLWGFNCATLTRDPFLVLTVPIGARRFQGIDFGFHCMTVTLFGCHDARRFGGSGQQVLNFRLISKKK